MELNDVERTLLNKLMIHIRDVNASIGELQSMGIHVTLKEDDVRQYSIVGGRPPKCYTASIIRPIKHEDYRNVE